MKNLRKTISCTLAVTLLSTCMLPVSAASESANEKEEVIYIITDAQGKTNGVYAVNIWNSGDVTDYGNYSSVSILNTNDKVTVDGDKITFSSDSDKVYCQGVMKDTQIPWNISIKYFLDGKEISPEDIAGKSGKLEIHFKVEENKECKSEFFDSYALQANFSLNTDLCKNINFKGATCANVGNKKQLTYTIFAGKGIDTVISSDVTDFEMDSVSINGVKLNMDIDFDTSELTNKLTDLNDGIKKIDDGAGSAADGSAELKDGSKTLKDGSSELSNGAEQLNEGVYALDSGTSTLKSGLNTLNSQSENLTSGSSQVKSALHEIQSSLSAVSSNADSVNMLVSASSEIKSAISQLSSGANELTQNIGSDQYKALMMQNGVDIDQLKSTNEQTITSLQEQISLLSTSLSQIQGVEGYEDQAELLNSQITQLSGVVQLLQANSGVINGTEQYLNGLSEAANQLSGGLSELDGKYSEFDYGISGLADSLKGMLENTSVLFDAINTLSEKYNDLDSGINSYTSAVNEISNGMLNLSDGVSTLVKGSKGLLEGANQLSSGMSDLYSGASELNSGINELSDGTGELKSQTSGMDTEVEDKIDESIESFKGKDSETVSFVSEKNTNVKSVQFVIKTDAIEIPEEEVVEEEPEEKPGFFQKLSALFK